jgi:hypothetical protein
VIGKHASKMECFPTTLDFCRQDMLHTRTLARHEAPLPSIDPHTYHPPGPTKSYLSILTHHHPQLKLHFLLFPTNNNHQTQYRVRTSHLASNSISSIEYPTMDFSRFPRSIILFPFPKLGLIAFSELRTQLTIHSIPITYTKSTTKDLRYQHLYASVLTHPHPQRYEVKSRDFVPSYHDHQARNSFFFYTRPVLALECGS